jgi:ABC-2 type transport system ATP-binding protein
MDHGRLLAEGTLSELVDRVAATRELQVTVDELYVDGAQRLAAELGNVPYELQGQMLRCQVRDGRAALLAATRAADRLNLPVRAVTLHEPDLESVFLQLTGRALRD